MDAVSTGAPRTANEGDILEFTHIVHVSWPFFQKKGQVFISSLFFSALFFLPNYRIGRLRALHLPIGSDSYTTRPIIQMHPSPLQSDENSLNLHTRSTSCFCGHGAPSWYGRVRILLRVLPITPAAFFISSRDMYRTNGIFVSVWVVQWTCVHVQWDSGQDSVESFYPLRSSGGPEDKLKCVWEHSAPCFNIHVMYPETGWGSSPHALRSMAVECWFLMLCQSPPFRFSTGRRALKLLSP